jgi:serine/threonine-protein kinase
MMVAMRGLPAQGLPEPPAPEQATVPNVVGLQKEEAMRVLTKAFFTPSAEDVPSTEPLGTVVAQTPAGGSTTIAGGQVSIQVSNGKAPTARVPGVVGLSATAASNQLRTAGFGVDLQFAPTNDKSKDGKVISQSPGGGAKLDEGGTVAILVGRYEPGGGTLPGPGNSDGDGNNGNGNGQGPPPSPGND